MPLPAPQLLTLTNDLAEIPRLAAAVDAFIEPLKPSLQDILAVQLALEETITNVIVHGYAGELTGSRTFTIELNALSPALVRATVADDAPPYNPLVNPEVNLTLPLDKRPIGGLGVHLIKNLMNNLHYERLGRQNQLTMERALNRSQPQIE